jgi:hypothetical protein
MTCKTAAQLGMVLSRTAFSACKACVIGKAKQCNIPNKTLGEKATIFNGRVGHDLAKIKAPEELKLKVTISKPNWHILVDEELGFNIIVNCQGKRQQQHHHQCTKGSTNVKMFTSPNNLDLFLFNLVSTGFEVCHCLEPFDHPRDSTTREEHAAFR